MELWLKAMTYLEGEDWEAGLRTTLKVQKQQNRFFEFHSTF